MVRLDTQASGLLFTGQAVPQTMRAAARATLQRGYTHFKFADAGVQQGSVVTRVINSGNAHYNGTYGRGYINGNANNFGSSTVVQAPTAPAAATVIMFRSHEPGAQGAFEAEQVLQQYSS